MLTCPMCKKSLPSIEKQCPTCRSDLSLLTDYVGSLETGLERAERLTRKGELGEAVWAYLEVLEVDPDNEAARQQVGRVASAVRSFDRASPARRWEKRLQKHERFRRWIESWGADGQAPGWLRLALCVGLLTLALGLGFGLGYQAGKSSPPSGQGRTEP